MAAADTARLRQLLGAPRREAAGIFQPELRVLPKCLLKICQKKKKKKDRKNPAGVPPKPPAHSLAWGYQEAKFAPGAELLRAGNAGERMGLSPPGILSHQTIGNEEEHPILFPKSGHDLAPRLQPPQNCFPNPISQRSRQVLLKNSPNSPLTAAHVSRMGLDFPGDHSRSFRQSWE